VSTVLCSEHGSPYQWGSCTRGVPPEVQARLIRNGQERAVVSAAAFSSTSTAITWVEKEAGVRQRDSDSQIAIERTGKKRKERIRNQQQLLGSKTSERGLRPNDRDSSQIGG